MGFCQNIDEFFDIALKVEDSYIKVYSHILKARSPFFEAMLSSTNGFKEYFLPLTTNHKKNKFQVIEIKSISKLILNCLIQYMYSDSFMIHGQSIDFYKQLLIHADYFMLPRLVQICSDYIKNFVTRQNVLSVLLIAYSHNAIELFRFCLNFLSLNEETILQSKEFMIFKKCVEPELFAEIKAEL